jgi:hypothetical protein
VGVGVPNYQVMSPTTWGVHEFPMDFDFKSLKNNVVAFENNILTTYQAPKLELLEVLKKGISNLNPTYLICHNLCFKLKMWPHFK